MSSALPNLQSARSIVLLLALLFAVSLGVRVIAAIDYGRDWEQPGSFTHINFDEGGSCRAALGGFDYPGFVGHQTLWLTGIAGVKPSRGPVATDIDSKAFCHGEAHLTAARIYSALTGALTVVVLFVLVQQLFPGRSDLALGSAAVLGLSGWHMSESLMGTVDAASTFFIYLFFVVALWAARRGGSRWLFAALALGAALAAKHWVFVLLSLAFLVPPGIYPQLLRGISRRRLVVLTIAYALLFGLVSNPQTPALGQWLLPPLFYALVPWRQLSRVGLPLFAIAPWFATLAMQIELFVAFTSASTTGLFGTDYGAIGWHKLPRNLLNIPLALIVGLGLPAFLAALLGLCRLLKRKEFERTWLLLLPLPAFLLYMSFLSPVTYYRHYLPLLPAACVLVALGIDSLTHRLRRPAWVVVLIWQGALGLDLVTDYHLDPRRQLPDWYDEYSPSVVMYGYYVNPPRNTGVVLRFFLDQYADGAATRLRLADTLVLSENWYDTAFANELNGPLIHDTGKLIKTRPQAVDFHRAAVSDEHPMLKQVARFRAPSFMPELLLHRRWYGSFTQFVGDILVFRVLLPDAE